jgi:3-hydroxyisobutyrate dehydrogenase
MGQANGVVVLGLGRMGTAMARRYADSGSPVTSWSRSGRGSATTAVEAVRGGDAVVLALYDGIACRAVLDEVTDALTSGQLVVNTSTVAPDEAAHLADQVAGAGACYVHAPVLGSVPAVLTGSLRVLAGGTVADVEAAGEVLRPLAAEVRRLGDPRAAAAAKLVANASLAGAALALRDALEGAAILGMPLPDALDILELGRLGDLVRGSRDRLETGGSGEALFTAGAITKDATLLARAAGVAGLAERLQQLMDNGEVCKDDDFTMLAVPPAYRTATAR